MFKGLKGITVLVAAAVVVVGIGYRGLRVFARIFARRSDAGSGAGC